MNNYLRQIILRALPGAACVRPRVLSLFEPPSPNADWKRALDLDSEILSDGPPVARDGGETVTAGRAPSPASLQSQLSQKTIFQTVPGALPKHEQDGQPFPQLRALTNASVLADDIMNQDLPTQSLP